MSHPNTSIVEELPNAVERSVASSEFSISQELVKKVRDGKSILFLGSMASAPSPQGSRFAYTKAPPSGAELSRHLAKRCEFEMHYSGQDVTNLQRVSLHFEFGENGSRQSLVQAIAEEITGPEIVPSPALYMLAALPFRIVITTNYDHLFDKALRQAKTLSGTQKDPIVRIYDPKRVPAEEVPDEPSEEQPILLKLHGDTDKPNSFVVTEEDYITFIERMGSEHFHPIHLYIRAKLRAWPTLFIGYGLRDPNLRLLFKTLRWTLDAAAFPLSYSVDPYPDNLIVAVWTEAGKRLVSFIKRDLWDFVPALYKEVMGVDYQP